MAVDGLGYVRGLVAYRVADVLDRDAVAAHDRDRGVPTLVGVPVADAGLPGHLGEAPVKRVGRVHGAVLVAEDEVVGVPGFARFSTLGVLPGLVRLECGGGALRQDEGALDLGVLVSPVLLALRQTCTTPPLRST